MIRRQSVLAVAALAGCTQPAACESYFERVQACDATSTAAGIEGRSYAEGTDCEDLDDLGPMTQWYRCRLAAWEDVDCGDQDAVDDAQAIDDACELFPEEPRP